jgi:hypothetical protein
MPDLKLAKLPDRTPVKITFTAGAELNKSLEAYAEFYREAYGQEEPVPQLVPYMLEAFLKGDSAFIKARREKTSPAIRPEPRRSRARDSAATTT